jgi:hypothetical protein
MYSFKETAENVLKDIESDHRRLSGNMEECKNKVQSLFLFEKIYAEVVSKGNAYYHKQIVDTLSEINKLSAELKEIVLMKEEIIKIINNKYTPDEEKAMLDEWQNTITGYLIK